MKYCGQCRSFFAGEIKNCPRDSAALEEMDIKSLVGKELDGKYTIEKLLGVGGMGAVFKARHAFIGNEVAIKVIHPEMAMDKSVTERFLREARAAATIDHVNAIRVSDFGKIGDMLYLVMEFIAGESMKDYLERKPRLDLNETVHIMNQVAAALDVAHNFQIVHRDLKPDNIMFKTGLKGERVVKVVDFGIAKVKSASDNTKEALTSVGTIIGTAKYMSPEQCQASPIDHRSDIYSLGVMVYEALTGQCPYGDANGMQVIVKHIIEPPPKPRSLNPDIPEAVEKVILKALSKQPTARYSSAGEFTTELTTAAGAYCDLTQGTQTSLLTPASMPAVSQAANNQTIASPIQAPSVGANQGNQTIVSPIQAPSVRQAIHTMIASAPVINTSGKRPKAMIVLEGKGIIALLKIQVQQAGFDVLVQMSSMEAVATIPTEKPDLIILGVELSQLSGPELCMMMRTKAEMSQVAQTSVLLYSGMAEEELNQKVKECRANGYIHKTWNGQRLIDALSPYLNR
ncbi:MAG: protein kinase [Acidobacteria bacterium]|nr:protein kinase [Acidobacteriota bacterium]